MTHCSLSGWLDSSHLSYLQPHLRACNAWMPNLMSLGHLPATHRCHCSLSRQAHNPLSPAGPGLNPYLSSTGDMDTRRACMDWHRGALMGSTLGVPIGLAEEPPLCK